MKIAIGVRHFRVLGGAENFVLQLSRYLVRQGHDLTVYAITGVPMVGVNLKLIKPPIFCPRFRRDWVTGKLLSEQLAASDADVTFGEQKVWNVNVVRPGGGVECTYWNYHLKRKWKSTWLAGKMQPLCPKRHHDLMAERMSLLGPSICSIIVNSDLVRRDMMAHYPSTAPLIHVVHNGADESKLSAEETLRLRQDMHRRLGLDADACIALFIGHDFYRKGLESAIMTLAQAMIRRPEGNWHLVITGRGHIEQYQTMAQKALVGDRIHYLGDMKDAFQAYAAADVLLLPTHYDPFASVTAEAICYGVPVITTADNGGSEIIKDNENGWVVDSPQSIDRMAECLVNLSDTCVRAAMKSKALESAKQCRLMDRMRAVERILEEAAAIKAKRHQKAGAASTEVLASMTA